MSNYFRWKLIIALIVSTVAVLFYTPLGGMFARYTSTSPAQADTVSADTRTVRVLSVSDGDTLVVQPMNSGTRIKVRLHAVDAPEYSQPYGKEAKRCLTDLLKGEEITLNVRTQDQYGRSVAELRTRGGLNINLMLLERGCVWYYRQFAKDLTKDEQLQYARAEANAKNQRSGLWQSANPTPPWAYRRAHPRN